MHGYLFAVYNDKDHLIKLYANETWAKKKAERSSNWRVETYVHTQNRKLIEIEEFVTRESR